MTSRTAVVHTDSPPGTALADGLADTGAAVWRIAGAELHTRADFEAAYAAVDGVIGTIVVPVLPGRRANGVPCVDMDDDDWTDACETPLRRLRYAVQAARGAFTGGGRIVLVSSTAAVTGERGFTAYSVVSEGARALVRVVARGWGQHGITLHWIGVPTALLTGDATANAARDEMWDHALGRLPDLRRDVAPAIASISGPGMDFVTGTATVIDGGLIMLT